MASATAFGTRQVIRMLTSIFMSALLFYPSMVLSTGNFAKLRLPRPAIGPNFIAFDSLGEGPYTGVADGRILKFAPHIGFQDFAFSSTNWSKALCNGDTDPSLAKVCGRPLAMNFYYKTKELYVCDAIFGLLVVPTHGGPATQVATAAGGLPIKLAAGVDVHEPTGAVYFTDVSARFNISQLVEAAVANDSTGRLVKYERKTKRVTVLLSGLPSPAGVAVSLKGDFLLFTEFLAGRVKKYWIKGPKASKTETLVTFPGFVDHIKRDRFGNYWIAVIYRPKASSSHLNVPTAVKIDAKGKILAKKQLRREYKDVVISGVVEHKGALYVGSVDGHFIGKYNM